MWTYLWYVFIGQQLLKIEALEGQKKLMTWQRWMGCHQRRLMSTFKDSMASENSSSRRVFPTRCTTILTWESLQEYEQTKRGEEGMVEGIHYFHLLSLYKLEQLTELHQPCTRTYKWKYGAKKIRDAEMNISTSWQATVLRLALSGTSRGGVSGSPFPNWC